MTTFVYRMKNTRASSEKFGPCEVCGKHADNIYLLTEMQPFLRANGTQGIAHNSMTFGHKDCLASKTER